MTNAKATKRALLSSALALFLCFAMLIGTTFAWFTDEVKSKNNIITAGNLDIELYYQVEGQTDWTRVTDTSNIFKEGALWEPGHTEVVRLKAVNEGTLALKYQLGVNVASETGSINIEGKPFKLSDYIMYGIVDGTKAYTRDTAIEAVKDNATALSEAYASGFITLDAKNDTDSDEKIVTLVVYMPESVGNEANAKTGADTPTIALGINIMATQVAAESDSFSNDYDADAFYADAFVTTDEALKAAIVDPKAKVIAVKGDLTYDWGTKSYENSEALYMKGKTIIGFDNDSSITFAGYGSANLITDVTLKNITVKDNTVGDNEGAWEHGHLEFVSLTANNVIFANTIMLDGNSTLTDCSMVNNIASWYGIWIEGGNTVIKNCIFSGTRSVKIHEAYGSNVESVVIDDCIIGALSEKPGVVIGDLDATTSVTIKNTMFVNVQAGDQNKYIYETDTDVNTFNFVEENNIVPTTAGSGADLSAAIANGDAAALTGDVQYNTAINNDATIYLAGNTFEATGTINLGNNADLTMKGGSYEVNGTYGHIDARPSSAEGSVLLFEDIDFSFNQKSKTWGTCTDRLGSVLEVCANAADAKTVVVFKNCTFDNAKVLFEGLSGTVGKFEATFENCTFNALTSSAPIEVMNYVEGTITVKNCTFNLECTSGSASAICVSPSSSTSVTIVAENNTINAVAATPHTYDPAAGETEVDNVKVYGTPSNVKFISSDANTTVTETNTVKIGIAG